MQQTASDYEIETIANPGSEEWDQILMQFDDANIFQTPSYGRERWPKSELRNLVLKKAGEPMAAMQVRLLSIPLLRGIAYVRWGPLWRRKGLAENVDVFRQAVRAIRLEFVERLGLAVQLVPRETEDRDDLKNILVEEGFHFTGSDYNTVLIDISGPEETIRSNLVARWRTDLNRSQRNELLMSAGEHMDLYDRFEPIYDEMFDRKKLVEFGDLAVYRRVQQSLPNASKMNIMLCAREDEGDGAGAITSAIGDTGLAILWATNHPGRDSRGAYYLQWETIRWLKQQGCHWYDLGGVSRDANPGGYRFKCGLAGKNGRETRFLGQFQASPSRMHAYLLNALLQGRNKVRELRKLGKRHLPGNR
ncbi:aminoacyltransferase [Gammaproteobacteria bacterium]|nr:aminoacyltransferase [Gammaproteobacteria bacterium]